MPTAGKGTRKRNEDEGWTRVAFVYFFPQSSRLPSFVEQDYIILSNHFHCSIINLNNLKSIKKLAGQILQSDISFSWFASGHSLVAVVLSRLFGKKSIVVAGGYDVAFAPEISYGQYTLGWRKRMRTNFVLKHADMVLAVSLFTRGEVLARAKPRRLMVLYNAVDTALFKPAPGCKKENMVLTVAMGGKSVIKLKGLDTFVRAAARHPHLKFIVVGLAKEDITALESMAASDNIELLGFVARKELIGYYQRAKVYCQLSYRESFGMALAEAMSCGCIPVATDRGALPEVVGDTGYIVPYGDPYATADAIGKALSSNREADARQRVETLFKKEKREIKMVHLINSLLKEDWINED